MLNDVIPLRWDLERPVTEWFDLLEAFVVTFGGETDEC